MSNSVQLHRRQPTRLPRPWDSPGKNTGVGCHFLLQCMKVKSEGEVAQSCPTLCDPMDCGPPGSSVHGIFQARVLEWGAIAFSDRHITRSHLTSTEWEDNNSGLNILVFSSCLLFVDLVCVILIGFCLLAFIISPCHQKNKAKQSSFKGKLLYFCFFSF